MNYPKPLEIATKSYYWKPMAALFRSLELRLYCNSGLPLRDSILDLGCGDGKVADMLRETGVIEKPLLCGMDLSGTELKKARQINCHLNLVQADANRLPFKNESYLVIVSNGVLCSIPEGVDQSLKEIHRVLKDKGILKCTVPTDKFVEVLLLPRILRRISSKLGSLYIKKINNRLPHFNTYSPQQWKEKLECSGLTVIRSKNFFSFRSGFIWSILAMQIFRIFGVLKFIRNKRFVGLASSILKYTFERTYAEDPVDTQNSGYIFIIAQKIDRQK